MTSNDSQSSVTITPGFWFVEIVGKQQLGLLDIERIF